MLELSWRGTEPIELPSGEQRRFLEDGDEVACIPPVAGGADDGEPAPSERILELAPAPLPLDQGRALADRLATPADGAVAVADLTGRPFHQAHACCSIKLGENTAANSLATLRRSSCAA